MNQSSLSCFYSVESFVAPSRMPASETSYASVLGIEFDEGVSIPVANAENKYLEEEVYKHDISFLL